MSNVVFLTCFNSNVNIMQYATIYLKNCIKTHWWNVTCWSCRCTVASSKMMRHGITTQKHPLNIVTLNRHWSRDRQRNMANLSILMCMSLQIFLYLINDWFLRISRHCIWHPQHTDMIIEFKNSDHYNSIAVHTN